MLDGVSGLLSFYSALSAKIVCIWFSVWAIRRKSEVDYVLSSSTRWIRWIVVILGFTVAYFAPLKSIRLVSGFAALAFLCWPNFAYHLTNAFIEWPTIEGCIDSVAQDDSRSVVTYTFELGQDFFGGRTIIRSNSTPPYIAGQSVKIAYDPLNPEESRLISRNPVSVVEISPLHLNPPRTGA